MNNNKNQQSNKKSIACSQVSIQEQKFKNFDYIALLKTFEMVRTMFSVECQDMIQEMLVLQNKLVRTEDIDSDLIQQEIKLQQKFSSQQLKFKDAQFQMAKLSKENKDLKQKMATTHTQSLNQSYNQTNQSFGQNNSIARYHKQSISVHTKLRPQ